MEKYTSIIFFDGVCNLCNGLVDFLMRKDRHAHFVFASLQGQTAKELLFSGRSPQASDINSVIYLCEGNVHRSSTALIYILRDLGGWCSWLATLLLLVPRPIRDLVYEAVARNRYRIFGKRDICRFPTPEERARFLD